jgi:CMP-N,N'-diacetyllegionaminic acid synthase
VKILCTICARGGSRGVPNKNIKELSGKPLISYTIELAKKCSRIGKILVSTDSAEIADVAKKWGAEVPFLRPANLAGDTAPKLPVIQHAVRHCIENMKFTPDCVIDLDPTSPLRTLDDINACLDLIESDPSCDSVITGYKSNKNPYFNMVEVGSEGFAELSKKLQSAPTSRQEAPAVYAMNASIYVWKTSVLFEQQRVVSGRVKLFVMPEDRSIDIDSYVDFSLVELLMKGAGRE